MGAEKPAGPWDRVKFHWYQAIFKAIENQYQLTPRDRKLIAAGWVFANLAMMGGLTLLAIVRSRNSARLGDVDQNSTPQ